VLAAGCAINPESGRPEAVLTTEKGEIEEGEKAAKEVENQIGLIDDPAIAAYVDEIGQRLVKRAARNDIAYHFHVVEMKEPNAFALPGGFIYVSRGLLAYTNNEDELACVIGHEIGHVSARHSVSRQTSGAILAPVQIAAGLGGWATSIVSPRLGQVVAGTTQLPSILALASYSRGQERQADELGQRYAAEDGWNPMAMSTFMTTLARESELQGNDEGRMAIFASHPPSTERAEETAKNAEKLDPAPPNPIAPNRAAFLAKIDGIVFGVPAREGVFVEDRFLHADMGFALEFPPEWEQLNAHSFVLAQDEGSKAFFVLKLAATEEEDAGDPVKVANRFSEEHGLSEGPTLIEINGLKAAQGVHVEGHGDSAMRADLTWVALDGYVFQLAGVGPKNAWKTLGPVIEASAKSFHRMTPAERKEVFEDRVRIAKALEGETIEALAERTESRWEPKQIAIANGLQDDAILEAGQLLKITKREPYPPTPAASPR
jgi:predicted Zn-dependent protease